MANDETFLVACSSDPLSQRTIKFTRFLASYKPGRKPGRKQVEGMSKACRKPAANLLKTGFFLHSICLARAQTSEPAAVRDQVFDKKVESVSQTRTNLSKTWLQTCRNMRPLATILTSAKLIVNLIFASTTA